MKASKFLVACAIALAVSLGLVACSFGAPSASSPGSLAESAASAESGASAASEAASSAAQGAPSPSAAEEAPDGQSEGASPSAAALGEADESQTGASAQESGFDFVDECTDEHGNVSLYALAELKGWQLETLLSQQGYEWDEGELAWIRPVDGARFSAYKQTGTYTRETYDQMNEKGGAIVAVGFNVVAGFKDPQAALSGNARCVVEASYFDGGDGIAIFYGPSMKEYLAIVSPYTESTAQIMVFSQEAVGSGMADQLLGTQVGGSLREVWKSVTGQDSYN